MSDLDTAIGQLHRRSAGISEQIDCLHAGDSIPMAVNPIPVIALFRKHTDLTGGGLLQMEPFFPMVDRPGGAFRDLWRPIRFGHARELEIPFPPPFIGRVSLNGRRLPANDVVAEPLEFFPIAKINQLILVRLKHS